MIWFLAGTVVLAVADWAVTWSLITETDEGTREVAGLTEGNLRAIQNPGTLLFLLATGFAWRSVRIHLPGLATYALAGSFLALVIILVGNIVEFGIWGEGSIESQDPGAAIFFSGLYLLMLGLTLLLASGFHALFRHPRRGT